MNMFEQVALFVQLFCAFFTRLVRIAYHRTQFVFGLDQLDGFVGNCLAFSCHKSNSIALIAHAFINPNQNWPVFFVDPMIFFVLQVVGGQDFDHARQSFSLGDVQGSQDRRRNAGA